jgi:hypothetical protein
VTLSVIKYWRLLGEVSTYDIETLQRAGVGASVISDEYPIDTMGFHHKKWVKVNHDVTITTVTNEQEVWLILCFGDRVLHLSTQYDSN